MLSPVPGPSSAPGGKPGVTHRLSGRGPGTEHPRQSHVVAEHRAEQVRRYSPVVGEQ